jgi:type II secretory pathway pseudopilin PulG
MRSPALPAIPNLRTRLSREEGISLIEAIMAMTLFVFVAAALGGLLTSAVSATKVARERTVAEQLAAEQIEEIRRLNYDTQVGTTSGNPPGVVAPSEPISVRGLKATMTTQIAYVNDPTPTSYATSANYKRVTVTITRNDTGKVLARQVTYVAPPARAPYGGVNQAVIDVQVVDYALNQPVENASVGLATGPSAPRSDVTDSAGEVTFAALTPNPLSGPTAYYDLSASKTGYVMLPDATATHLQLAPGQTATPKLQIYRPSTIRVELVDPGGTPYTGTASVTVTSGQTGAVETHTVTGGVLTLTQFGGQPIVPSFQYTAEALSPDPYCAAAQTSYVPEDYAAGNDTKTFVLTFGACPSGGIDVTVEQLGNPVPGATVTMSGGPNGIAPVSATADSNGFVSFTNVPAGDGYLVEATNGSQNASQTVSVAVNTVTTTIISLPDPPGGTVDVTATWAGVGVSNGAVTLSGGPYGINRSGTAVSGTLSFPSVPAGSGYTVTVTKTGASPVTQTVTGLSVSVGGTTPATLAFTPTKNLTITVRRGTGGSPPLLTNAAIKILITGGPNSPATYRFTPTTNGSGQVTVAVPSGSGNYTIRALYCPGNPRDGSTSGISAAAGTTTASVIINASLSSSTCNSL